MMKNILLIAAVAAGVVCACGKEPVGDETMAVPLSVPQGVVLTVNTGTSLTFAW